MTAPAHSDEHNGLMQIIGKLVNQSTLIEGVILITIGKDSRPCVGANIVDPAHVMAVLRTLSEHEDEIAEVYKVVLPRDN